MATTTHVSSPATGAVAIHALLTLLLAAGWRVLMWSDGTTYTNATGAPLATNPFGSGAAGAGNLGNVSAWFRIRASDSSREWLFQRNASDDAWTINRSAAGFSGGTPAATTLPTATDGTALFSAAAAFTATPGRLFASADDASGYGWRLMCITSGGGNVLTLLFDEPLDSPAAGDTDPYIWSGYYDGVGLAVYGAEVYAQDYAGVAYKRFVGAGSNQRITLNLYYIYGSGTYAPPVTGSMGGLPSTLNEVPLPIPVSRYGIPASTTGWCGFTRGLRWATVQGRANGQTLDGPTGAYWIYAAGMWLPWDISTPALA